MSLSVLEWLGAPTYERVEGGNSGNSNLLADVVGGWGSAYYKLCDTVPRFHGSRKRLLSR
jgi:hypothetical protein